jgi:hypothetical protein
MTNTETALVGVIRRLIRDNKLCEQNGEDTIGVLMKCGAFLEAPKHDFDFVVKLAAEIDSKP